VLGLLLLQPDESLHGREIARRTGLPAGTLTRELRRLAGVGVLTQEKRGNQTLYRANRASPIFAELAEILRKTSGLAEVVTEALSSLSAEIDVAGTVLLCLHQWGAHEHPTLSSPDEAPPGNGLLLFFRVDDFDEALPRARSLVSALELEPQVNPATGTREFALRDLDGYYVMVSALD
jgi:DNA-binding transcriptional ArsR family regulator